MQVREVFGWLRYCLSHDEICAANQIVVEEIPSPFENYNNNWTDGPRTLVIYRLDDGYYPRVELRFTYMAPQVWIVYKHDHQEYVKDPWSSKFPGDFRVWSRSQFVAWLIDYVKAKLCSDTKSLIDVIPDNKPVYVGTPPAPPKRAVLEAKIQKVLQNRNDGLPASASFKSGDPECGIQFEEALASGELPLPYLDILQKCDLREEIAPWSLIRRTVLAFAEPTPSKEPVADAVLAWLEGTNLYRAVYQARACDELRAVIKKKLAAFADGTVDNPLWVREALDETVGKTGQEKTKCLQGEFDMWLLHALSPSVAATKLPLSPHAYNVGREEEALYQKVFAAWLGHAKRALESCRDVSIKILGNGLEHFYQLIGDKWQKESLEHYQPKPPSFKEITSAVKSRDRGALLNLLLADVEDEVGAKVPDSIKADILEDPYFNTVYREVRFQNLRV